MEETDKKISGDERELSRVLGAMEKMLMEDGKIDLTEAGTLLRLLRPLADAYGSDFKAFYESLRDVREDGVITNEESKIISRQLAALADLTKGLEVRRCPECGRVVSMRGEFAADKVCPWCGKTVEFR